MDIAASKQRMLETFFKLKSTLMREEDIRKLFVWRMHTETLIAMLKEVYNLDGSNVDIQGELAQFLGVNIECSREFREDEILLVMKVT